MPRTNITAGEVQAAFRKGHDEGTASGFRNGHRAGRADILEDITAMITAGTDGDGWNSGDILTDIDQYLKHRGYQTPDSDDLRLQCDSCGKIGTSEDLCEPDEDCPDEDCDGTTLRFWTAEPKNI